MELEEIKKEKTKAFKANVIKSKSNLINLGVAPPPTLILTPLDNTFSVEKRYELYEKIKVGRQVSPKTAPEPNNGFFDSKVLSRAHAEIWAEGDKVYIKDVKSSNGTYLNGNRLSGDSQESSPQLLFNGDILEFGIDIFNDNGTILYQKIAAKVKIIPSSFNGNNENSLDSMKINSKKDEDLDNKSENIVITNKISTMPASTQTEKSSTLDQPSYKTAIKPKLSKSNLQSSKEIKNISNEDPNTLVKNVSGFETIKNGLFLEVEATKADTVELTTMTNIITEVLNIYPKHLEDIKAQYEQEILKLQLEITQKDEKYQRLEELTSKREIQLLDEYNQLQTTFKSLNEEFKQIKDTLIQKDKVTKNQEETITLQNEAIEEFKIISKELKKDLDLALACNQKLKSDVDKYSEALLKVENKFQIDRSNIASDTNSSIDLNPNLTHLTRSYSSPSSFKV